MKHFLVYCSVSAILLFTLTRCSRKEGLTKPNEVVRNAVASTTTGLQCTARPEQTNYMMYRMHNNDDARAGDIAPFMMLQQGISNYIILRTYGVQRARVIRFMDS